MDTAAWLTAISFAVQIAAGVAPMKWPQHAWLAGVIFWLSLAFALICSAWWFISNQEMAMVVVKSGYTVSVLLVVIAALVAWMQWRAPTGATTTISSGSAAGTPRPVFESSSEGKISGQGMNIQGQLPPSFARTDTGGQIILDNSTVQVVPSAINIGFPPPDGAFRNLSALDLEKRLAIQATKFRDSQNQSEWISLALEGRSLCSEALNRLKSINFNGHGGTYILMVYVPDKSATIEAAKFLDTVAEAVTKL